MRNYTTIYVHINWINISLRPISLILRTFLNFSPQNEVFRVLVIQGTPIHCDADLERQTAVEDFLQKLRSKWGECAKTVVLWNAHSLGF